MLEYKWKHLTYPYIPSTLVLFHTLRDTLPRGVHTPLLKTLAMHSQPLSLEKKASAKPRAEHSLSREFWGPRYWEQDLKGELWSPNGHVQGPLTASPWGDGRAGEPGQAAS